MKQSHNALTYLRAQYRAIYGRAYIKGLATAMIVTSAFATSMAHAANINIDFGDNQNDPNGQNQGQDATAAQNDLSSYATQEGYTATEQAADQAAAIYRASQDAQARALAANYRSAPTPAANTPVTYAAGDPIAPNHPNGLDDFDGTFLDPLVVTKTGQTGAGAETWATTVTINSGATYNIKDSANGDSYDGYSKLLVGSDTDAQGSNRFNMASDATLNMGGNTALQINGIGNDTLGGNINLNATAAGSQTIISVGMATDEAAQVNSKLTVNGNINVGSGEGTAAIYAPNVDLKGDITVGSGGTLVLDGALTEANPTDLNANHGAGTFKGNGTDVTINDGGRVIVGQGSADKNTVLDLGDGASKVSGTGTLDIRGTAILTDTVLDQFVSGAAGTDTGDVTLQSGGRMELKASQGSSTPVDLAKYQFGTTDNGDAQINVVDGDEANTIAGDDLALSSSIRPDGRQEDLNLDLEATNLTLGGGVKADGTAFDSAAESLGYRTAVTQNVTFKTDSGGQTFHLHDGVTLDGGAHNGQTGTGSGTSTGDVVLMGGGAIANVATNLENAYRVAQGNYTHSGTVTMSGGTLAVGAYGEANDGPYSGDATLALSGSTTKIVVDNTNASNTIIVASNGSGSTATLDLSQGAADAFTINRGDNLSSLAIGQAGTLDDGGRSEVKLTADQFNALINTAGASGNGMNVVLAGNGVLQVPDGAGNTAGGTGSTASLNTSQLQKITDNAQATRTDIIYFNQGGRLEGKELQVRNDGTNMDIGQGTVAANKLDVVQDGTQSGDFVINSGNIETSHLSSSDNSVSRVQVGNNNADPAQVTMVADPTGASGSINVAINVNGNGQGQSSLNFKSGTWDVDASQPEHAITIDGTNASLNVGEEGAAAGSGAVVTLNGLQVTNNGNVNIASESDLKLKGQTDLRNGNLQGSGDLYLTSGSTTYLNESSVDNFVNAGSADAERNGGRVVLEGGNLDITATDAQTPVLLNDYSQGVADTDNVDLVVTAESTISSNALAVNDKLNDGWKDKVTLVADDLVLGGKADTDYSTDGYALNFKEAIASNTVRFEPTSNSDPNAPTVTNTDFYLRDHVTINAYERNGDGTATSLGNVHIRDLANGTDEPTYQVLGGTVTHQVDGSTADNPGTFDVTGAKVQIGGADSGSTAFGKDATLQFANDDNSVTDVTIASGSEITIVGNGESSKSTLDLTGANAIHTSTDAGASSLIAVGTDTATAIASGNTTAQAAQNAGFSVPSDSFFKVNDTQLNQLFKTDDATGTRASGDTNVKVVLGQTGTMHINQVQPAAPAPGEPPVTVEPVGLDISFLAGTDTSATGSDAASLEGNKIYFDRGGRLEGDALSLTQKNTTTNANLNIGAGTVSANDLALSNDFTGSPDFVVEQGTLEAGKSVNVMNGGKLQLGTGTNSGTANLNLGTYTPTITTDDAGKTQITVADGYTEAGDINAAIALNGNASINVNAGKWVVNNDITSSGTGNKINVGLQGTNGELPMVTDESGNQSPLTAELEAKSFNVGTGNEFNIRDNGTATFTEAFSSSGGKTVIDGKLVIGDEATGDLLTGDVSGHGELEVQGTALLTTKFLNDFTSGDAATGESGGTITLNAGTADFTQDPNATTLDMKNFKFSESFYGDEPDPDADFNIITARNEADPSMGTVAVDASVIKGKEVLIDQSLVTNNTVGSDPDELNLDIHATEKVTLGGGNGFTSANTVLGYHQLVTKNAEFKADSGAAADTAFTLHDGITFVATDSNGEGTTGTSTGNVIVKGGADNDFNSFNVAAGTITHSGDLTLDGGELLIGSTEETRTNIDVEKADATLAMASGSKLTIDNTNAPNSIKVQSNGYGSTSTLDLSQLEGNIELKRGSNLTTVTVGTPTGEGTDLHSPIDAILKLNTSSALLDLDNTNVAADQQGLAVVLTGNGALEMVGTDATLDVANIDGYSTTPQSDKVIFSGGGIIMGQDFTLTNQDKNQNKELDLGGGTIWAEKLHLDNAYRDASAPDEPTNLVLATGKIVVGQELTSTSNVIQIGTGEANDKNNPELGSPAEVHLGYFTTTERGSAEVDSDRASSEQGTVQGNILVAGDYDLPTNATDVVTGKVQTNASLHVDHGTWTVIDPNGTPAEGQTTAFGDVTVQNGGYLEIGGRNAAGELYVQEGGNEDIDGDGIPDNVGGSLAVLQGDRLLIDGASLTIHANGGAIFNSYDHINGSEIYIKGETHFNGRDESGEPIHPVDPNAPILISGRNASMNHGEGYNQYFQVDDANDTVTTSLDNVFLLKDGATLAFALDENTDFSLNQIKQLRQQLISKNQGEVIEGGYIDLGKATTTAVTVTTDSAHNNRNVIDYSTQSGSLADIKDMVFSNTSQATLTNVTDNDELNVGTVGSVELSGSDTTFKVQDADLAHATDMPNSMGGGTDKYFAFNTTGQSINAEVTAGGHLGLHNGGTIGNVTLADGIDNGGTITETELLVKSPNGGDTHINSVSGGKNSFMGIYDESIRVQNRNNTATVYIGTNAAGSNGTIDIDTLDVNGNLTAYNKVTVNKALLSSENDTNALMYAHSLEVNGTTLFTSNLKVQNDATFNATASGDDVKLGDVGTTTLLGKTDILGDATFNGPTFLAGTTNITKDATFSGSANILNTTSVSGNATFNGNANINSNLNVGGNLNVNGVVEQAANSSINASGASSKVAFDNSSVSGAVSHLNGTNTFHEASFTGNKHIIGGTLTAETVTVGSNSTLQIVGENTSAYAKITNLNGTDSGSVVQVGQDGNTPVDNPSGGTHSGSMGILEVSNVDLKGGTLFVDPDYKQPTAFTAIENVENGVNGNIVVGKNAAIGLGGTIEELQQAVKAYQQDGSLQADQYGAILAVNKPIKVQEGQFIAVSSHDDKTTVDQINEWRGDADLILSDKAAIIVNLDTLHSTADTANSEVATLAATEQEQQSNQLPAAISFEKSNAKVVSEGGDLILKGNYDATKTTQIFQDAENNGVTMEGEDITVRSNSNRFIATLKAGENTGAVTFTYNKDPNTPSNPVDDFIEDNFNQGQNQNNGSNTGGTGTNGGSNSNGTYNDYVQQIAQEDVNTLHSASYLSTFAGAPHAALRAGQSTAEAFAARMDPSLSAAAAAAQSAAGLGSNDTGSVWLSPVYSHTESDGFAANTNSYGTDIDLTGVALGAEIKLNPNVKLGAAVNIGTGSADGTGKASTVSNDFNYYGAGAYIGADIGKVSILGDVTYTVVDNDVTNNAVADKYNASYNSTNLSAGVTGKVNLELGGFNVAPHVGVRYSRIDVDDYSLHSAKIGNAAQMSSSSMNLLSVPVGVTLSRDINLSSWKLKPMVDLTVTGNFGDTDMDSSVKWGNSNPFGVNSEVVDDFTYGVKAGLEATNGNLKVGFGVGYTGSENTDELNVGAEIRYNF